MYTSVQVGPTCIDGIFTSSLRHINAIFTHSKVIMVYNGSRSRRTNSSPHRAKESKNMKREESLRIDQLVQLVGDSLSVVQAAIFTAWTQSRLGEFDNKTFKTAGDYLLQAREDLSRVSNAWTWTEHERLEGK